MASTKPASNATFEEAALASLQRVRAAFAALLSAAPGNVTKAVDLHRWLRLDTKLCWKIFRVAGAGDPFEACRYVPGPSNMQAFLRAARKARIPRESIEAASEAVESFESMVATHAGDRATFDSMLCGLVKDASAEQIHFQHRRAAFRAQRHIYGLHAQRQLKCMILQPADDPRMLSVALIEGFYVLRQLRAEAGLVISYACAKNDDGTPMDVRREPVDSPAQPPHGIALLREFCSHPLPEFRAVEVGPGNFRGDLVSNGLGNEAAITCIVAHMVRSAFPRFRDEVNRFGANLGKVRLPCETLILDLIVRDGTYESIDPKVLVWGEHRGELPYIGEIRESDVLPPGANVAYLGRGPTALHTPDVPRYAEMGRYIFDRLGWDGELFDVYRCQIEYPIMPSSVAMHFELPEAPGT